MLQLMRDKGIYDIVRDGPAMVLGVSAGSMNMGKTTVDIWESMVPYEGLGFADITMIGHFSYDDTERLRLMKAVSMERPVCAMEDESAIFITDGTADIMLYDPDSRHVTNLFRTVNEQKNRDLNRVVCCS